MSTEIRPLRAEDYAGVLAVWQSCAGLGELESRQEIERFLQHNPGLSAVAVAAERIVGAVLCGSDGRRGYLYHLAVAPDCRQQRVADALVAHCLEQLAAAGIRRCSIHLYADNASGESFWRKTGWRERTDLKVFARDLTPPPTS